MPIVLPEERVGTVVAGRYRLTALLGEGGMGAVYAAVHEWTSRPVALKFSSPSLAQDEEATHRFLQEARAAARLDHPNVVDVLDMGRSEDGAVFLVLEQLDGEDLERHLTRAGRLSVEDSLELLLPVMDALAEAHALGIVHRDIKPSNIFLAHQRGAMVAKVLDFGIARMRGNAASVQTQSGKLLGTPYYMAPEQVKAEQNVDAAADIWAIGVVLYRCLSGRLPVSGGNSAEVMMSVVTKPRPKLSSVAPDVPPALAHSVDIALERDPLDRHSSMGAFASALRRSAEATGLGVRSRVVGAVRSGKTELALAATTQAADASPPSDSLSKTTPFVASTAVRTRGSGWGKAALVVVGLLSFLVAGSVATVLVLGPEEDDAASVIVLPQAQAPTPGASQQAQTSAVIADEDSDAQGTVTVRSNRSCLVSIDGEEVGGAPVLARPIGAGEHMITCQPRRGEEQSVMVDVVAGVESTHAFRFSMARRTGARDRTQPIPMEPVSMDGPSGEITREYD